MLYAHKTSLHCRYMDFAKFNNMIIHYRVLSHNSYCAEYVKDFLQEKFQHEIDMSLVLLMNAMRLMNKNDFSAKS
jgi:hypothetical protein